LFTILILVILLIVAPGFLEESLTHAIASVAHYAGNSSDIEIGSLPLFVIKAFIINVSQVFVIFIVLFVSVCFVCWLYRHLLTWYQFESARYSLMTIAYVIVLSVAISCGLSILPLITNAILQADEVVYPGKGLWGILSVVLFMVGIILFFFLNRRYSKRCPKCNETVDGWYRLGKECEICGEVLFSWLLVEYEV